MEISRSELKAIIKECLEENKLAKEDSFVDRISEDTEIFLSNIMENNIVFFDEEVDRQMLEEVNRDILLEYDAKPEQVKEFKRVIEMVKYIVSYYINVCTVCEKVLNKIVAGMNKCKTRDDVIKLCNTIEFEYTKETQAAYKDFDSSKGGSGGAYSRLRAITNKFSIKYSDTFLEEKKVIDKELEKLSNATKEIGIGWYTFRDSSDTSKAGKLVEAMAEIEGIDEQAAKKAIEDTCALYSLLLKEINGTMADVSYIRDKLRLGKEKSIVFKVVNKIFKSNKSDN